MKANFLNEKRTRRAKRTRIVLRTASRRPRLSVFKSGRYIYAQVIDDAARKTLAAASSRDLKVKKTTEGALALGKEIAEKAKAAGVDKVVFDRGRYRYHGIVKAVAEGARSGGLIF